MSKLKITTLMLILLGCDRQPIQHTEMPQIIFSQEEIKLMDEIVFKLMNQAIGYRDYPDQAYATAEKYILARRRREGK